MLVAVVSKYENIPDVGQHCRISDTSIEHKVCAFHTVQCISTPTVEILFSENEVGNLFCNISTSLSVRYNN
ncbi:hypothetical protein C0J52_04386 [Blattella germanica]|nr:hypothetical protein C0J52_04386 [Blattella germanica]